jgi:hypothetical protein
VIYVVIGGFGPQIDEFSHDVLAYFCEKDELPCQSKLFYYPIVVP